MSRAIPPSAPASQDIRSALAVYARMRVLIVLLLGFASGLPLALSSSTLAIWLADSKVDIATIGLLSLAGLPYTFKFFWAPLVDALHIPVLSELLGRRRAWLVVSQLLLTAAIFWLASLDPMTAPLAVGLGALMVAFAPPRRTSSSTLSASRAWTRTNRRRAWRAMSQPIGWRCSCRARGRSHSRAGSKRGALARPRHGGLPMWDARVLASLGWRRHCLPRSRDCSRRRREMRNLTQRKKTYSAASSAHSDPSCRRTPRSSF
jgi:hypothetical protein